MRRLLLVLVVSLVWVAPAGAWTWPVDGPVLLEFSFDPTHPYAAGQHRGIDVGGEAGEVVAAPAGGVVTFAGTVPGSGKSVTILTSDAWSVTLTQLGTIAVTKGATVAEGDGVGTIGPSGDAEVSGSYVQLGVRHADQDQGYVDPESLLPARSQGTDPSASSGDTAPPPAIVATPIVTTPIVTTPIVTTPIVTTPVGAAPGDPSATAVAADADSARDAVTVPSAGTAATVAAPVTAPAAAPVTAPAAAPVAATPRSPSAPSAASASDVASVRAPLASRVDPPAAPTAAGPVAATVARTPIAPPAPPVRQPVRDRVPPSPVSTTAATTPGQRTDPSSRAAAVSIRRPKLPARIVPPSAPPAPPVVATATAPRVAAAPVRAAQAGGRDAPAGRRTRSGRRSRTSAHRRRWGARRAARPHRGSPRFDPAARTAFSSSGAPSGRRRRIRAGLDDELPAPGPARAASLACRGASGPRADAARGRPPATGGSAAPSYDGARWQRSLGRSW